MNIKTKLNTVTVTEVIRHSKGLQEILTLDRSGSETEVPDRKGNRIVFCRNGKELHSITAKSSNERIQAHWDGFIHNITEEVKTQNAKKEIVMNNLIKKIQLKKVQFAEFNSQETNCFEAELWYNKKHVANVSNAGHGGGDDVRAVSEELIAPLVAECKEIAADLGCKYYSLSTLR